MWQSTDAIPERKSSPFLSVIIPTYNRSSVLLKCLSALLDQTVPGTEYEILVVDDGSSDRTVDIVEEVRVAAPVEVYCLRQNHKGPAAARNSAIRNAQGDVLLFIGDDILASPTLLTEHAQWHRTHPEDNVAVLGYVTWSSEILLTPFMRFLSEHSDMQFAYGIIQDEKDISYQHFYTSNISLKRTFLLANGLFDEDFPDAGQEDIELGYRLERKGLRIVFNRKAVGYHLHPMDLESFCRKMEIIGFAAEIFNSKHPEVALNTAFVAIPRWQITIKHLLARICLPLGIMAFQLDRRLLYQCYKSVLWFHLWRGHHAYLNGTTGERGHGLD